jgi:hypothetical protein
MVRAGLTSFLFALALFDLTAATGCAQPGRPFIPPPPPPPFIPPPPPLVPHQISPRTPPPQQAIQNSHNDTQRMIGNMRLQDSLRTQEAMTRNRLEYNQMLRQTRQPTPTPSAPRAGGAPNNARIAAPVARP